MKRNRGFTVIELMIVLAIIGIIAAVVVPLLTQSANSDGTVCKGGYKFTGRDARAVQIIDAQGHGIPCEAR